MTTITTTTQPAQRVVGLHLTIPSYPAEGMAWDRFMQECARQRIPFSPQPCGATFFDDSYQEGEVDLEVWQPVGDDVTVEEPLAIRDLPEQRVVVATLHGSYDGIGQACDELAQHLSASGLTPSGHMFNRYLVGPGRTNDPSQYVTEICLPIES